MPSAPLPAAILAAGTIALWPASETDKARDNGQALGTAVNHLFYAESTAEVDTARAEIDVALDDLTNNAGDFRAQGPEVRQAFYEGFDSGLNA